MGLLENLKQNNKVIKWLSIFFESAYFPFLIAIIGTFAAMNKMAVYIPLFWIMTVLIIAAIIVSSSLKVFFVPILMLYFAIGSDVQYDVYSSQLIAYNNVLDAFELPGLINLVSCGVVIIIAMILKLIISGTFKKCIGKKYREEVGGKVPFFGSFGFGLIIFSICLLPNGLFSSKWEVSDIVFGIIELVGFTVVYLLALLIVRSEEINKKTETDKPAFNNKIIRFLFPKLNVLSYCAVVIMSLGLMISFEMIILLSRISSNYFIIENGLLVDINREWVTFSWGIGNMVGAVLTVTLIAPMYLAYKTKSRIVAMLMLLVDLLIYSIIILTNCRDAILVGCMLIILLLIMLNVFGNKKKLFWILSGVILLAIGTFLIVVVNKYDGIDKLREVLDKILRVDSGDSGRFSLWENGMNDFVSSPVFGAGFADGGYEIKVLSNLFSNMYHNIVVELLGACGVVGMLGFLMHFKDFIIAAFKKTNVERFFLMFIPLVVIALSIVDNYFWYLNLQLLYGVGVALVEYNIRTYNKNNGVITIEEKNL